MLIGLTALKKVLATKICLINKTFTRVLEITVYCQNEMSQDNHLNNINFIIVIIVDEFSLV